MKLQKGAKVRIIRARDSCFAGRIATVDHPAPDRNNTIVYRLRIGYMVLPGWFAESDLEVLYRPYTTLIMDFEGTVSDTSEGEMRSFANALEHFGIVHDDLEELRVCVGRDPAACFRENFMMKTDEVTMALQFYRQYYNSLGIYGQALSPGMPELLQSLRKEGFTLVAFSMKSAEDLRFSLEYLEAASCFDVICGMEAHSQASTETELLDCLLRKLAVDADRSGFVMIGDGADDMRAAAANGIDSIGVLWGYGSRKELQSSGAGHIAGDHMELATLL